MFLAVITELASSPDIDDNQQARGFYKLAKDKDFKDAKANENLAFWLGKPGSDANLDNDNDNQKPDLVYRSGPDTKNTFTPRPGRDVGGPKEGLSTFRTIEQATQGAPNQKYQIIDLNIIRKLGFVVVETPDGHVSIKPPTSAELKEWAATRETEVTHYRTVFARFARIGEGKTLKK